jgi:hypothetical protein
MLKRLILAPGGDSLLLCSGYISEPPTGYTVLGDELLKTIKSGCSAGEITTVAGKLERPLWLRYYRNFVIRLRTAGLAVKPYIASRRNWHAKAAIRLSGRNPIAAIVGSSNLTGPAYGENRPRWNFEGDVLIWQHIAGLNRHFSRPYEAELPFGDMQLVIDPDIQQLSEDQQLISLYEDILGSDLEALED